MGLEFLVSVGRVVARDPETGAGLFYGNAMIETGFDTSMTATDIRGGRGNALLMTYMTDKKVALKINQPTFSMQLLGFNSGQLSTTGTYTVLQTESVVLSGNTGSVTLTPISDIAVYFPDGSIQNVTPATKSFTVTAGGSLTVTAIYTTQVASVEQVRIEAATPPKLLDITIIGDIRNDSQVLTHYLQISIPKYQVDGSFNFAMTANGVSQMALSGFATVATDTDGTYYYAKQWKVPAAASSTAISMISALPSTLLFTAAVAGSQNVSVLGTRGTVNENISTSCSFVTNSGSFLAGLHTGVITISASAAISASSGSIVVSYLSGSTTLTDSVNLLVS
jgi:hypothetical protein